MCLVLTGLETAVWAQGTAQVSGAVTDQSGAVLPGVEITLTQTATGQVRTIISNEVGSYVVANLPIGPYRIEATLPGFRTFVQTGLVLAIGANIVVNVALEVGQVAETVEVQSDAIAVETRTTSIGQLMDNVRILELPLNGRDVSSLILLTASAVQGGDSYTMGARGYAQTVISVGGGMGAGTTYLLDGGGHNDPYTGLGITMPFPDALQEFKVETSAMPASVGHHSAAAVNGVTKSGTNQFHGSLFEFFRNGKLNARNFFARADDTLKRNQFGGTIGGPLVENKLFFFAAHQTTKQSSARSDFFEYVPTPAMMAGDFRTFMAPECNAGRAQAALRAPFGTNGAAANTVNPADWARLVSPAARNVMARMPAAQTECGIVRYGSTQNDNNYLSLGRVDYQVDTTHTVFARYLDSIVDNPDDLDPTNVLTMQRSGLDSHIYSATAGSTYLFGSNVVNSFRAFASRITNQAVPPEYFDLGQVGVKNIYSVVPGFVLLTVTGGNGFTVGSGATIRTTYNSMTYGFNDDVSWVRGTHQLGIGGQYIRTHSNNLLGLSRNPRPTFNGQVTGRGLADFLLGNMSSMIQGATGQDYKRQHYVGLYLQDSWRASQGLTLNMGIRWEPFLPPSNRRGYLSTFDEDLFSRRVKSTQFPNAPAGLQFPGDPLVPNTKFSENRYANFAPRFGLAWDPLGDGRMSIRAAYGIFYELPYFQKSGVMAVAAPWAGQLSLESPTGGFDDPWRDVPGGNPFPVNLSNPFFPRSGTHPSFPRAAANPYVNQWNLSIQQQLARDWMVSANYLGTSTIHLWSSTERNPVMILPAGADGSCMINGARHNPCNSVSNYEARRKFTLENPAEGQFLGVMPTLDDGATSSYHGMVLTLQRRTANSTIQGNYTWSHCIGTDELVHLGIPANYRYAAQGRDYYSGDCSQDRRQSFRLSTVNSLPGFSNRAVNTIFGNWRVSGIVRIEAGGRLTLASGRDTSLTNSLGGDRPDQILADAYATNRDANKFQWLNRDAFVRPPDGRFGNSGFNAYEGPGNFTIDMGLTRTINVREGHAIEFRAEAFNVLNHVNLLNPTTNVSNTNFGLVTNAGDPRIIQLALKYVF